MWVYRRCGICSAGKIRQIKSAATEYGLYASNVPAWVQQHLFKSCHMLYESANVFFSDASTSLLLDEQSVSIKRNDSLNALNLTHNRFNTNGPCHFYGLLDTHSCCQPYFINEMQSASFSDSLDVLV